MLSFRKSCIYHLEAVVIAFHLLHIVLSIHVPSQPTTLPMVATTHRPSLQVEVIFCHRIAVALVPCLDHHWPKHETLCMCRWRKVALIVEDESLDKLDGRVVELHLVCVLLCMDRNDSGISSATIDGGDQVILVGKVLSWLLVVIFCQTLIAVRAERLSNSALVRPNLGLGPHHEAS